MPATVVIGLQWGDEGKGKIVDVLAADTDIVARFQGGSNAGHTVIVGDKKYVFHMMPSGVLHPGVSNVIGNGVVVDPFSLCREIDMLKAAGIDVMDRLLLSEQAHIILPLHAAMDAAAESAKGAGKIGTTLRGIGLAYADKARRVGLRLCDFRRPDAFARKYRELAEAHGAILRSVFNAQPPDTEADIARLLEAGARLAPMLCDSVAYLNDALAKKKNVLCEGAQGVMLDLDHGTYPYVTSSNPTTGGACTGLGIPPGRISRVIGVVKAYTTRVGEGPFPTELLGEAGEELRRQGGEFGATTGRPRRCGWLDIPLLRRATQICGCTEVVVTKLDVLDGREELPVCMAYDSPEGELPLMPFDPALLAASKPRYETFRGWGTPTTGIGSAKDLPDAARAYVQRLEAAIATRVSMVSTGPARDSTILMQETLF